MVKPSFRTTLPGRRKLKLNKQGRSRRRLAKKHLRTHEFTAEQLITFNEICNELSRIELPNAYESQNEKSPSVKFDVTEYNELVNLALSINEGFETFIDNEHQLLDNLDLSKFDLVSSTPSGVNDIREYCESLSDIIALETIPTSVDISIKPSLPPCELIAELEEYLTSFPPIKHNDIASDFETLLLDAEVEYYMNGLIA